MMQRRSVALTFGSGYSPVGDILNLLVRLFVLLGQVADLGRLGRDQVVQSLDSCRQYVLLAFESGLSSNFNLRLMLR